MEAQYRFHIFRYNMTPQLQRKLGVWTCVSIVIGAVIGSSIFMKPATMAAQVGSPYILIAVWLGAGIISLFGAMINAEVGTVLPQTGGQYVYFQKMYGDFFAFLSGWAGFIVVNTAAVAAIAFVFAQYAEYFIHLPRFSEAVEKGFSLHIPFVGNFYPLQFIGIKSLAIALIVGVTIVNHYSVGASGNLQVIFTFGKVAVLLLFVGLIFFSGKGDISHFNEHSSSAPLLGWTLIAGIVAATSGALSAYDGWNNLGMVAGEIVNPQKNITRGLLIGIGVCIALYLLTNIAYIYMLDFDQMSKSTLVASDALDKVMGKAGGGLIALLVMISTLGAVNGNALPCARITFAMGAENLFFRAAGKVHSKHKTPSNALWMHCIWSCLFVLTGSFDMLTDLFVFITWIFYGFAGAGVFILRKKMPDAERPYKVWGYPVVPLIFIFFALFYFILTIYNDITYFREGKTPVVNSVLGLLLTATGIPFYLYFKKRNVKETSTVE